MTRALALVLLSLAVAAPARPAAAPPARLADAIDKLVAGEPQRWGVTVARLDTGQVVYEHNAAALLQPASNQKVFTTAAALDALGPQWTTKTSVYATDSPGRDGVLKGDLVLYGRGDPNLSGRFSASHDALEPLRRLAEQVRARGITRVEGGLVADESYLSGPPHGSGWAWEDLQWHFGAEVSALSFDDNLVAVRVAPGAAVGDPCVVTLDPDVGYIQVDDQAVTGGAGSSRLAVHGSIDNGTVVVGGQLGKGSGWTGELSVHAPALYAAAAFRRALADAGVVVTGPTTRLDAYMERPEALKIDGLTEVASLESLPLSELVKVVNKHSQNLHAETILRLLGRERGPEGLPSDQAGVAVVRAFLQRVGALADGAVITDGCGLSRLDRVTPGMLEGTLRAMNASPVGPVFNDSLPIAGYDGTLQHRLSGVVLRAKTGSLSTAKSLSGYVTAASGERLVFSVVYNNQAGSAGAIGQIDRIASAIASTRLQ